MKDFRSFLAIFFNMCLLKKLSIAEYWNVLLPSQASVWFRKVLSRNRFQIIMKFLHVADFQRMVPRQHPAYDPASRFRPLLSFINNQFRRYVVPKRELCVDETLVGSRGHSVMRQYIPSKASKYGVKFWMLCEAATGYIMQMFVYRGKEFDPTPRGELQGTNVVHDLLSASELLNKGYHVFCDSFFCSIHLGTALLRCRTYLTGTLRKNRPMPLTIRNGNPDTETPIYMRNGQMLCLVYRENDDKKPTRLLSTLIPAQQLPTGRPRIVQSYNKYMGAVDLDDALMSSYCYQRKNKKVWKKIVLNLFHRIMLNAYILYSQNTSDRPVMSRLKFIQLVVESLADLGHINALPRNRRPRQRLDLLPGRREKDCCVCSKRAAGGVRRRSRTVCSICKRGVHRHCLTRHAVLCNEQ
ncbi:piggyBac transposable element-derived protein 4-like [Pecten maximus]|uniref:piggyBac transposable element-derived protein 4-like n=1 Tax=Pecten maximus TaxID=6579 RepID=UPI0014585098|nr:piggyBac transposable element-derived protein 4-like [Pecten maximus]